jgi:2-polyprenyl-3-methyl-5-hydroxy-6-metoxy-1,4-benzoquinol methylase
LPPDDPSHGYDALAASFAASRNPHIGVETVRSWARTLPRGSAVLDLGCGTGVPVSRTLIEEGLAVHGIDASPGMVEKFRSRFPGVPVMCEPAETSDCFGRQFDGIIAWGLIFLLPEESQVALIRRVAAALRTGGSFLFTAPEPACTWNDLLTGRVSTSLGAAAYRAHLADVGLTVVAEHQDAGDNHYLESRRSFAVPPDRSTLHS